MWTATHCNTLQHTATCCNALHHRASHMSWCELQHTATHCNTLQHAAPRSAPHCFAHALCSKQAEIYMWTATHCNTMQHTATHCTRASMHCNTLQHTASHCTHTPVARKRPRFICGLQHTASQCNTLQQTTRPGQKYNTLQHTATHCTTPQPAPLRCTHPPAVKRAEIYLRLYICTNVYIYVYKHIYMCIYIHIHPTISYILIFFLFFPDIGWLRLVGSLKSQVSFAKEPYKRDDILQKRHIIWRSLLIVATPYLDSPSFFQCTTDKSSVVVIALDLSPPLFVFPLSVFFFFWNYHRPVLYSGNCSRSCTHLIWFSHFWFLFLLLNLPQTSPLQ